MYEILEHKKAVEDNIKKAFGNTLENTFEEIEKAKWQIGEVRVDSRGIAHECFEYVNGKPHLRRVKKNKGASTTSTVDNGGKKQKVNDNIEVGKIYVGKFDGDTIEYEVKEKRGGGYQLVSYTYGNDEDEFGNPKKYTDIQEETKTLEDMVNKIKKEKYFDLNNTTSSKNKNVSTSSINSEIDNFMKLVQKFSGKYTDENKVTVTKTPKGNWEVSYDGHRLGIINADQLSEKTAKSKGWLKEENDTQSKKKVGKDDSDESDNFDIKIYNRDWKYKGNTISKKLVEDIFSNYDKKLQGKRKINSIKEIDDKETYIPDELNLLFKYPDNLTDKKEQKIYQNFNEAMKDHNIKDDEMIDVIRHTLPISIMAAIGRNSDLISNIKLSKIGEVKENVKSNNIYSLMAAGHYDLMEVSFDLKVKSKVAKVKTYVATDETLSMRDVASFL